MSELRSHNKPSLTLAEHLAQIREAACAIWGRHSRALLRASDAPLGWFDDAVTWHDAGKASQAFQRYIQAPAQYRGDRKKKVHTPLSTVCALRHAEAKGWDWRRTLAVALLAAGHHSEFKTHQALDDAFATMDDIIGEQIESLDWDALDRAIGARVPRPDGLDGVDLCVAASDYLEGLVERLHGLGPGDAVAYRLQCQLIFSVLLEADKAFLAVPAKDLRQYLAPRQANLPASRVEEFLAEKPPAAINFVRESARRAMFAGLEAATDQRIQTMTLPTGTGKTLLAASWALSLRERIMREEGQPPLILIVLPYLAIIDQTVREYDQLLRDQLAPGEMISFHSLSDRTYAPDLEDESQDFFLNTWQSDVVITTFDQFLFALLSPKGRHQMRFHHLADALIVMDEVQALPCVLWDPLRRALAALTQLGSTHVLTMSATQPNFLLGARELIERPADFFAQMKRYRIELHHRAPLKLAAFASACSRRLRDWIGKRVLLTLNTRRSARHLRDALALDMPADLPLEFLSADVTPKDRLAAILRIRNSEPCVVVSTQCVEAGVDIDMDPVIRDFAPLDSIIQIAGRCNRNGRPTRGTVEIVSLLDDDTERPFAGMIYDKILLQVTREVLGDRSAIDEEQVFPLTVDYFARLSREKDTGEGETRRWARWEEMTSVQTLLRGARRPQVSFLILGNDPPLRGDLEAARGLPDRWDRRRALQRLARRIAENTVSVYPDDGLDPANCADPFPANARPGEEWFWLLRDGYYTAERGLDLRRRGNDQESLGLAML